MMLAVPCAGGEAGGEQALAQGPGGLGSGYAPLTFQPRSVRVAAEASGYPAPNYVGTRLPAEDIELAVGVASADNAVVKDRRGLLSRQQENGAFVWVFVQRVKPSERDK